MAKVRMFVGIPLSESLVDQISVVSDDLRTSQPSWRNEKWVARDNLHLTLAFLGDVEEECFEGLGEALDAVAGAHDVIALRVSGLSAAPSPRRCRMIWAEFDDAEGACARLAADITAACPPFCDVDTERAFRAHATLCRARRPHHIDPDAVQAASDLLAATAQPMSVPCFTLFSSRLTPRGPIYSVVRSMRLNEA